MDVTKKTEWQNLKRLLEKVDDDSTDGPKVEEVEAAMLELVGLFGNKGDESGARRKL